MAVLCILRCPDTVPGSIVYGAENESARKPLLPGVYVSQHFSLDSSGKACGGKARVKTPPQAEENRPSGMRWEASGNVNYGGIRNPPHNRKGAGR